MTKINSQDKLRTLGPYQPGEKGFVLLYDTHSVVKPFFQKLTSTESRATAPSEVVNPYPMADEIITDVQNKI